MSQRTFFVEGMGEWWIAKDGWAIRGWWEIKSLKKKVLSESLHFWWKDKRLMKLTNAVHTPGAQEIIKEWDLCVSK